MTKTKSQWVTKAQKQEIYALGEAGILYKDIAKMFGIHPGSVGRILTEAGITRYWTKGVWRRKHKGREK